MNTLKLLRLINVLLDEDGNESITQQIAQLHQFFSQQNIEEGESLRATINEFLEKSEANNFPLSDLKILEKLKIKEYFGSHALEALNEIFNSNPHKYLSKLNEYKSQRVQVFQKLKTIKTSLEGAGLQSYNQGDDYEIGIIFPDAVSELKDASKEINVWHGFLVSMSEFANNGSAGEYKIRMANDGCWELFIGIGIELAEKITSVFNKIADFVLKVQEIRLKQEEIKAAKMRNEKKLLEALTEEEDLCKNALIGELVESVSNNTELTLDRKPHLEKALKAIVKSMQKGVQPEVNPPQIEPPELQDGKDEEAQKINKKKEAEYRKKLEEMKPFYLANQKIAQITSEGLKLLDAPNTDKKKIRIVQKKSSKN